jgi:hydrogenase maturation factor
MHDPTEGGLSAGLWEMAEACGCMLIVDPDLVLIPPLAARICQAFQLDPFEAIASGALLIAVSPEDADQVRQAIQVGGIPCTEIGEIQPGPVSVRVHTGEYSHELHRPERDAVARLFDT